MHLLALSFNEDILEFIEANGASLVEVMDGHYFVKLRVWDGLAELAECYLELLPGNLAVVVQVERSENRCYLVLALELLDINSGRKEFTVINLAILGQI